MSELLHTFALYPAFQHLGHGSACIYYYCSKFVFIFSIICFQAIEGEESTGVVVTSYVSAMTWDTADPQSAESDVSMIDLSE